MLMSCVFGSCHACLACPFIVLFLPPPRFSWRVKVRAAISHLRAIRLVKAGFLRSGLLSIQRLSVVLCGAS
ncbi:hypothetical protein CHARACLAT_005221 [Characodon lateralis]|uniref:Secreted protein n=1 Tax=Characodon lateralis TaxID=208331 RepID=A0ABU7CKL4_9TELE|nr:hypothetical protein [Characodon lateralis]